MSKIYILLLAYLLSVSIIGVSLFSEEGEKIEEQKSTSEEKTTSEEKSGKADDELHVLDEIVVTAKGAKSRVFNTSLPMNVINRNRIEQIQPTTTGDLFKHEAGIDVSQTGPCTERPMIRGLYDSRVLILINGIKLSEQRPGGDHALSIDPSLIKRIEVVRGPASVLYGSEAIGGVINFITKNEENAENENLKYERSVNFGYDSASNGFFTGLTLEGGYKKFNYYLDGSFKKTDDIQTPRGTLDNSGVEDYNYSAGADYSTGKHQFGIYGFGNYANIEVPTFSNDFKKARFEGEKHHGVLLNYEFIDITESWKNFKIDAGYQIHNRRMRIINDSDQAIKIDVDFHTINFNPQTTCTIGKRNKVTTGLQTSLEIEESDRVHPNPLIDGVGVIPPSNRLGIGIFAQDEITVTDRVNITVGLRYDLYRSHTDGESGHPAEETTKFDHHVGGNIGFLFGIVKDYVNLTANVGRAFRAPTLHERFFYGPHQDTADYGNADLKPETSWNVDAGIKLKYSRIWFTVSGFYNHIFDYIEKRLTGGTTFGLDNAEFANVSKAALYGGEFETEVEVIWGISLFGNMSYVRGRNLTKNENLSSIPPLKGNYGIRYKGNYKECHYWSEILFHSAARQSETGSGESSTPGYTTMDVRVGALFNNLIQLTLYCKNCLDTAYHNHLSRINSTNAPNVDGLEQPGRSFGVNIKFKF